MSDRILGFFMSVFASLVVFLIINNLEKNPEPLPHSENPRKEKIEVGAFTLITLLYFSFTISYLSYPVYSEYIQPLTNTTILFLIPFLYIRYKDNWTSKNYGFNSKIRNGRTAFGSILISIFMGYLLNLVFI